MSTPLYSGQISLLSETQFFIEGTLGTMANLISKNSWDFFSCLYCNKDSHYFIKVLAIRIGLGILKVFILSICVYHKEHQLIA